MARTYEVLLPDRQWKLVEPFIPKVACNPRGGRPRADDRACLEGILWVLRSGARWKDLPERFPSPSTCWRRLSELSDGRSEHQLAKTVLAVAAEPTTARPPGDPSDRGATPSRHQAPTPDIDLDLLRQALGAREVGDLDRFARYVRVLETVRRTR